MVFPHFHPFLCTIMHETWWQNTGIFRRRVLACGLIHLNLRELLGLGRDMCSTEGHFLVCIMFLFYCIMSTEFKETLASNFRLTMGQLSNVKGVTCNQEFSRDSAFPAVLHPLPTVLVLWPTWFCCSKQLVSVEKPPLLTTCPKPNVWTEWGI